MRKAFNALALIIAIVLAPVSTSLAAAIIGNTNNGTLTDTLWYNGAWINACRFQAASNMTVVTMHAKVGATTGKYKCAIYSDSSTQPNRLLRATAEVTNPATNGWYTFTLTAAQPLTNGNYYWLAIWSDSTTAQAYYSDTSGTIRWAQYNYGSWPDPLVTTDGSTTRYCIYAQAATATLSSIAVTPANPTITAGNTQQFTATGTYSDSSTQNLTSQVTWNSSNTARATINTTGLATGLTAGTTTISATLGAVSGNTVLTVQPAAPTVAITSPANNATVGTNFTINATATDADGTVTNVYFYDGTTLLGNDTSSPYSYAWNGAPLGAHALKVVARDNSGLWATSSVVNVTVTALNVVSYIETFDSYTDGTLLTAVGGGSAWGPAGIQYEVVGGGGVNGSAGLSTDISGSSIFNWKAQTFQWSALAVGTKLAMSLDFQTSPTGKFDDDRVGWTITPDASTSTGSQLALQLDNTTEGGMVLYHNSTRTPVLNPLSGIKSNTWYRFNVEFTKLGVTNANIVGTLTELTASGNPTGTPYVGTITNTSTFANPPTNALFTAAQQCPSFKNYNTAAGNADNASFTITLPGPQPPTVAITSPLNNATVNTNFTITATATDEGTVTSVSFYDGSSLLGSDSTSPFTYAWSSAPLGAHALKAVAWDNDGMASTSAVVNVTVAAAAAGFTAYNDCSKGDGVNPANTTEYPGNGSYSGLLKDFNTGAALPVTLTIVTNLITYDGTGGPMPNAGTDAYDTFNGKVVFDNVIWYTAASNGFWMDAVFTGLDPAKEYEFAASVNRGGSGSDYGNRFSKFTISDLDSADNSSTAGVTVNSATSVTFCSGSNTVNGYVARWTRIKCGTDGDFKVRVEDGGGVGKGYAFDGIMLREAGTAGPQRPTVAITSPANNASVSTNFTITATATDTDGTVTNVYFYNGSTLLGSDSSSPYTYTWSAAPLGAHALKAVAWDDSGLGATSAVVNITVISPSTVSASESFDSYANGMIITNIGGGGVWTSGTNTVLSTAGLNGSGGISSSARVFNWKAQTFQWSALADGTKVAIGLDFQTSPTGKFDDDRVGWTITPDTTGSTGSQLALQLDNTTEGGMVFYHNLTRTPVLNALSGIKSNAWYRFNVEFTKLGLTNASVVGTLTELDASGNPTGTPYVGTITNTGTFANPPTNTLFTAAQQCPSFKNHNAAVGYADNASFSITPPESPTAAIAEYVIVISVDGLGGTYLSKLFDGTATGGPYAIPNLTRFKNEGAGTLAAHCDNNNYETLPNHTSIVTARPQVGTNGHNWTSNGDPAVGQTIHSVKGSYVVSGFDVAHDNGLRTGMYANKSKFSLFHTYNSYTGGGSYDATYGAEDITGEDNGRDKLDNTYINTALGGIVVNTFIAQQQSASSNQFVFIHINEPDAFGHSSDWGSATWNNSVVTVDTMLGNIFKLVEQDVPAMIGKTAIILTADHGNQDDPPTGADRYSVPFYVWGPGVQAGADLYALNTGRRQVAASYPMTTYSGIQPIRNAEAFNLALQLLGLGAIPGSTFNSAQDLLLTGTPITVTANSAQSKVFGADDPVLTYVCSNTNVTFTGALSRAAGENVGSYAINLGSLSAGGSYVINFVPASFAITAKPITVTADSGQSKVFGASDPVLTYVSSDLGAGFTGALGRTTGENAGNYAINQGSLSAGANYTITFVPASFAITPAASTTAISSSLNPSTVGSGVTFSVSVGPVAPAVTTPTGNVQFFTNSVAVDGPIPLSGGTATLNLALLPPGTNAIIAFYLGDGNYLGSTDSLLQVVNAVAETPSVLGILPNGNGSVTVTFAGTPGAEYLVLGSTSIVSPGSWLKVSTNTAGPDGRWTYTDNTITNYTQRFFRAAKP